MYSSSWLLSLSMFWRFIHVVAFFFLKRVVSYCMNLPQFIYVPADRQLGHVQFGAIMSKAALAIRVQVFVWTYIFISFR